MPLTAGTRLGPYEIVAPLGAGGMGEVYRAKDTRLGREVAVKVLPEHLRASPEMLARFEREASVVASLSHPNVLALHDVGAEGGTSYAVMELIEGQTLRDRLADGPLAWGRALPLAIQLAHGLAAAHDRGIVHRDLKPENVIVTPDGRAKILDFGLARVDVLPGTGSQSMAPTLATGTEPGMVLGTYGYMSPEQVRGEAADARSDLFALGAVIYEMVSGRRAFQAGSPAETMSAVLREDPPDLARLAPDVSPALDRIIRRCLEKQADQRFRSAADLAYALDAVASMSSSGGREARVDASPAPPLSFKRLTFRYGHVSIARFTPDGAGIVYGAAWDGGAHEIFASRIGSPEFRSLGLPAGSLLAMSASGEMAISLGYHYHYFQASGTLARVALAGGGVRTIQKDVGHVDWSPDGKTMALVRYKGGRCFLEYPAGKVLYETNQWVSLCRVSPDGRRVAFGLNHRSGEGEGDVLVADLDGTIHTLEQDLTNLCGIAWSPSGAEAWYSGINLQQRRGIWGAAPGGAVREVLSLPTRVTLHDVRRDGRVLISTDDLRNGIYTGTTADEREVDVSWFDGSVPKGLSDDGSQLLSIEACEAENPHYAAYLRGFDGSPAVRLGDGIGTRISADGEWLLSVLHYPRHALMLYPIAFGEAREVHVDGIDRVIWAGFHPDGAHTFVVGSTPERSQALYLVPLTGGKPRLLWGDELVFDRMAGLPISPDGERLVLRRATGEYVLFAWGDGSTTPVPGLRPNDIALSFDAKGDTLYVTDNLASDRRIDRLDLATGVRTAWRTPAPPDPKGVIFMSPPYVAANGSRYAYSYLRVISSLHLVEGLGE